MTPADLEVLRSIPFLEGARPDVLERLAQVATEGRYSPGEVILEEGTTERELYLILDGLVEVVKRSEGDEMEIARRGAGDFFGEMGFLEGRPRFATVRALQPTRVLAFSQGDMEPVLARQPDLLRNAVRALSRRLREADRRLIADLRRKNEALARAYRELQEAQAGLLEKERLEHELEMARELQQSILPHAFPDLPRASCAARSRPARQVGGDFYDVIRLRGGRVGMVMADVSDKGMPAALYMALARSLIRAEATHHASPRQVLLSTHRLLLEMTEATMFVTVFYGVLDLEQRSLRYARAGHNYPLLIRPSSGECRELAADGIVLGIVRDVSLVEAKVDLEPGDLLVLYTDGITDANSESGEFFGTDRLRETVRAGGALSAQRVCDLVFDDVDRFQAGAIQYDDMAVLVVRIG
ncbi:MAG: SpoIIE family protein phosphatase [Chloroflexota bacterium]|nr:SpoIIE family protein phosphatase [Chloroflexota bacterium]